MDGKDGTGLKLEKNGHLNQVLKLCLEKSQKSYGFRAQNNGWSTDNVRPDKGFDGSNILLAGHIDRTRWLVTFIIVILSKL